MFLVSQPSRRFLRLLLGDLGGLASYGALTRSKMEDGMAMMAIYQYLESNDYRRCPQEEGDDLGPK